jgi:hypothetical protein
MLYVYISTTQYIYIYNFNLFAISMQLYFNLKFKDLKFGWKTFKQMTHGNISTNLPKSINELHVFMFIVKKVKMIFFLSFLYLNILRIS